MDIGLPSNVVAFYFDVNTDVSAEATSTPEMPAPITLPHIRMLPEQFIRRAAL